MFQVRRIANHAATCIRFTQHWRSVLDRHVNPAYIRVLGQLALSWHSSELATTRYKFGALVSTVPNRMGSVRVPDFKVTYDSYPPHHPDNPAPWRGARMAAFT